MAVPLDQTGDNNKPADPRGEEREQLVQEIAEFALNHLSEDVPSLEDMEDLNRKTEEDRILELLRQLPRSKQAKLRALDSFLEDDMHTEVERQRIQYELDATPPEEDAIAINIYNWAGYWRGQLYDELAIFPLEHAHLKTLHDLRNDQSELDRMNPESMEALARIIASTSPNKFPKTDFEFQVLSVVSADKHLLVARYLTSSNVEDKADILKEGGWHEQDAEELDALYQTDADLQESVRRTLLEHQAELANRPERMEVDAGEK